MFWLLICVCCINFLRSVAVECFSNSEIFELFSDDFSKKIISRVLPLFDSMEELGRIEIDDEVADDVVDEVLGEKDPIEDSMVLDSKPGSASSTSKT